MAEELGLPKQGQSGLKLVRRSMAKLLRDRLPKDAWIEIELFLGHVHIESDPDHDERRRRRNPGADPRDYLSFANVTDRHACSG